MSGVYEHFYACPYCGETISSLLDLSEPAQRYIEDCEVCCCPIELTFELSDNGSLQFFSAQNLES
jgi:transcription elongation factor Elf1